MSEADLNGVPPVPAQSPEPRALRISAHTAAVLLTFTLVFTALMAGVFQLTKPLLDASALDAKRRTIAEVLPSDAYDNDLLADTVLLPPNAELGLKETTTLYRARKNGQRVALVFETVAPDGYAGEIRLLLAVQADGRLAAVRVIAHKETPGLGDYIDPKKDKNKTHPWIAQFDQRNFSDTPPEKWRVKKDGGVFEQRTGATISARAVTKAIAKGLAWALERADALYALPANSQWKEQTR